VYNVVVKKVHIRYLISWWVSCTVVSSPFPSYQLPRRLSSVLSKFSHKKNFTSGVTPCRVSPGAVPPVTPLAIGLQLFFAVNGMEHREESYHSLMIGWSDCDQLQDKGEDALFFLLLIPLSTKTCTCYSSSAIDLQLGHSVQNGSITFIVLVRARIPCSADAGVIRDRSACF